MSKTLALVVVVVLFLVFIIASNGGNSFQEKPPVTQTIVGTQNITNLDNHTEIIHNEHIENTVNNVNNVVATPERKTYPDGTLLKQYDGDKFYIIEHGKRRLFLSTAIMRSYGHDPNDAVLVSAEEMNSYLKGSPIRNKASGGTGASDSGSSAGSSSSESSSSGYSNNPETDNSNANAEPEKKAEPERPPEPSRVVANLIDPNGLSGDFLKSPDGVLADEHYMQGKLSYPFTVARPEDGLLQVTINDVVVDGTWVKVSGIIPAWDSSRISSVTIEAAAMDQNDRFSEARRYEINSPGVAFRLDLGIGAMTVSPQKVVFKITHHQKGQGQTQTAALIDANILTGDFLRSPDGVLADEHYMQGKLSYPFTVSRPEDGLLQLAITDVVVDGTWVKVSGIIPYWDSSKITGATVSAAVVDQDGKFSEAKSKDITSPGVAFRMDLGIGAMTGSPQKIVFKLTHYQRGQGQTQTAKHVGSRELAADFLKSPDGVLADDKYMQGKLSYPFTVARPEDGLLQVTIRTVALTTGYVMVYGMVPAWDASKIDKARIEAAVIDQNGKYSEARWIDVNTPANEFRMDLNTGAMTGSPQKVVFRVSYHQKGTTN